MKNRKTVKKTIQIIKDTFKSFSADKVTKLSGSLAYSTIFSMGPLLLVLIAVAGLFLGREAAEGKINNEIVQYLGKNAAGQINEFIKRAAISGQSTVAITVGSIILFLGATTIFAEIQDSINHIWGIKPKPKKNWIKIIQNRFLSFSIIVSLGFLLLVSLIITALIDGLVKKLQVYFPEIAIVLFYIINQVVTFIIVTTIFGVIYKVLPDARIKWRHVITGAIVTAILFMLGKLAISFYISKSNIGTTFGAAGSVIVLLVWVYYSSLILYLGAEFTKTYTIESGSKILPNQYAVTKKEVEVELGNKPIH